MQSELLKEMKQRMEGAVNHYKLELKSFRTGRASIGVLEPVMVSCYGQQMPINQVANLTTPDSTLIIVQPWDQGTLSDIERAIRQADIGLNPVNDGKVLKVPIPALTEELRQELVKKAHALAEDTRNAIRKIRRDGNDHLKSAEKDKEISEDDMHRGMKKVQEIHDDYMKQLEQILKEKEEDIMGDK